MISIQHKPVAVFVALLLSLDASADMEAVTKEGRKVVLKDDKTWEYMQPTQSDASISAVLSVINVEDMGSLCKLGLRLQNNLGYKIKSLVPSFTAYKTGGLRFDSVSKSFSSIKPTLDLYREIQFHGLGCSDIDHIQVHGADQCDMGPLDKYNNEEGECLRKVFVQASDLINIRK